MAGSHTKTSMRITIYGKSKEIRTDDYSLAFAAGEDAAILAAGEGISDGKADTVFRNRREHKLHQLQGQRTSGRDVIHWIS